MRVLLIEFGVENGFFFRSLNEFVYKNWKSGYFVEPYYKLMFEWAECVDLHKMQSETISCVFRLFLFFYSTILFSYHFPIAEQRIQVEPINNI